MGATPSKLDPPRGKAASQKLGPAPPVPAQSNSTVAKKHASWVYALAVRFNNSPKPDHLRSWLTIAHQVRTPQRKLGLMLIAKR